MPPGDVVVIGRAKGRSLIDEANANRRIAKEEDMKRLVTSIGACALTIAAGIGSAIAQDPTNSKMFDALAAEAVLEVCFVQSVAAFPDRVHILCTGQLKVGLGTSVGGALTSGAVRYFAVENSVAANAMALTVLSVANAAVQRNRSLTIVYRTDPKENPAGCHASNCRRIVGVILN
jgi:hypothetical protein